jgi:hypothetical protein
MPILKVIFDNAILRIPFLFGAAIGAVIAIAGGFVTIYKAVTLIGN